MSKNKEKKNNTVIHAELNDKQQKMYDTWIGHIKAIYGEYGQFTWKITHTGIGICISVYSDLTKTELELTDVDSW
jgi:hypothetical protein